MTNILAGKLPSLPFGFQELEPFITEETLKEHYLRHHKQYVDNLEMLIRDTEYAKMTLEEVIFKVSQKRTKEKKIFNNACQAWCHTFFWNSLTGQKKSKPSAAMTEIIEKSFSRYDDFVDEFTKSALEVFGSGWVWLVKNKDGHLDIISYSNTDCPLVRGFIPLLVCDIWEHAYYLDYKSDRKSYVHNFWNIVNWDFVEKNYNERVLMKSGAKVVDHKVDSSEVKSPPTPSDFYPPASSM